MEEAKKKRSSTLLLEDLPNEIFRQIFSYVNGAHAFLAFSSLNYRFQCLILDYCTTFDFKSIEKTQFDYVFRYHNTRQWTALQLVNDKNTPGQIEYFIEKYSSFKDFTHLKSLSLVSTDYTYECVILKLAPILENIVTLTVNSRESSQLAALNLPKLKHLVILQHYDTLADHLHSISQLESLEVRVTGRGYFVDNRMWPTKLKKLKVTFKSMYYLHEFANSLKTLSQLETLEIYQMQMTREHLDGDVWESIISSSLPLLKHFKFYFHFTYSYSLNANNEIQHIIDSYSTPFYTIENNWFIRCHYKKHVKHNEANIILYTLPCDLDQMTINTKYFDEYVTTLPNDKDKSVYKVRYSNVKKLIINDLIPFHENFCQMNLEELKLKYYINFNQWSYVLRNLRSLEIDTNVRVWSKMFIHLFDCAPNLCELKIEKNLLRGITSAWTDRNLRNSFGRQIHSLDLRFNRSDLSNRELRQILPFIHRCRHLTINYDIKIGKIIYILQNMRYLQDLRFKMPPTCKSNLGTELEERKIFLTFNCFLTRYGREYYHCRKYSHFETALRPTKSNKR
ncbi:unnamed protein product [Adineta ricciae]|uniref:F-box domain-containing protein n=1 Tax=Adineta ricciae TaxID=249248 RepID=A0A814Z898_ADIRI|nr:unnamed protein product [Adineta ricciae]CAF1239442.1 unnamed protein product [Adineta ricciae]